jgi:hypothetical protein
MARHLLALVTALTCACSFARVRNPPARPEVVRYVECNGYGYPIADTVAALGTGFLSIAGARGYYSEPDPSDDSGAYEQFLGGIVLAVSMLGALTYIASAGYGYHAVHRCRAIKAETAGGLDL